MNTKDRFTTSGGPARTIFLVLVLAFLYLPILMLAVTICPLLLLSVSFRFISVVFLIGLSGPAYLAGIYFKSIFRRYETASAA